MVTDEKLEEHARHVQAFMKEPGGNVGGPDLQTRRQTPEERPFSPASQELRRLYPDEWFLAAMRLFDATGGTLSLAFMPANETEWQVCEAFAAYRLSRAKEAPEAGVAFRFSTLQPTGEAHRAAGHNVERRPRSFHWRGRDFHGLVCVTCNALFDDPEDSFWTHATANAKECRDE